MVSSAHTPIRSRAMSICARSGSSNCLIPFGFTQNFVALLQFGEKKCCFNLLTKPELAKFKTKLKQKKAKNSGKRPQYHHRTLLPCLSLTRKCCCFNLLTDLKVDKFKAKRKNRKGQKFPKKTTIPPRLCCPASV